MNLRLKHRIYCLLILTTLAFSTASWAADKEEEVNENVEEWLNDINKININQLNMQENATLKSTLIRIGELGGYIGAAGMFCYNANTNFVNLSNEIAGVKKFKNEFEEVFKNLKSEGDLDLLRTDDLVNEYIAQQCPENYSLFNANKHYCSLCKLIANACVDFFGCIGEERPIPPDAIEKFAKKAVEKSKTVFINAESTIKANACDTQLRHSILLWIQSAYYIYQDYNYLGQVRERMIAIQELLEKHIDKNDTINLEHTKKILMSLDKIVKQAELFLEQGQTNLEKLRERLAKLESPEKRQQFIIRNLPNYITNVRGMRDDVNKDTQKLIESVNKLTSEIQSKIKNCHIDKKQCETKGFGQFFLATANLYGSYLTYNLGNVISAGVHGTLAGGNLVIAKWAYDEYQEITKALVQLRKIFNHYNNLHNTITEEETKLLAGFATFISALNKAQNALLKEDDEGDDMDFDWDQE